MADLKAFAEQLVNLTVKEVNELANILKEEYGIEPAAAAVAVAAPAAGGAAAAAEEKTSFDVILKSAGAQKLAVVILIVAGGYEIFNPDNCPRKRVFILVFYLFPFNHFQVITLVFSTNVFAISRLFLANRS